MSNTHAQGEEMFAAQTTTFKHESRLKKQPSIV